MVFWSLLSGSAWALGESADIELIRPTYSPQSMPGIDTGLVREFGHLRLGTFSQYARDPLVLYADGSDQGAVVARRLTASLGLSFDLSERASARLSVPLAGQWGSENPGDTGSSLGMGDTALGIRVGLYETDMVVLGARADVALPVGTRLSWLGEERARVLVGGLAMVRLGPFDVLADLGVVARSALDTERDFTLGNELTANLGGRLWVWPERTAIGAVLVSRTGTAAPFQSGAETSSEVLSTLQWDPEGPLQWQTGVGKGLSDGYGTSEFRAFLGVAWVREQEEPYLLPPPALTITETPEPIDVEELVEQAWEEDELARIEERRIVIRDPIQFEYNTARILPASIPTLRYVAQLMNSDWRIGHVVIEGHASEEGSFEYNYELSALRARSIWEELQRAGVHSDRLSYRGMGEVLPSDDGADESSLASNRRVEFHVVRQYAPNEGDPTYRPVEQAPWDGDTLQLQAPVRERPVEKDGTIDVDQFLEDSRDPLDPDLFEEPEPVPEPEEDPR
ncbi:MAG: outer membrane protein OmpA-like peptidoglycan-associated protein [Myxococcota bacterium]|jgi:outer membrane protein OmpA-like peptidoglycan-associated protein